MELSLGLSLPSLAGRKIGGAAPSAYLGQIATRTRLPSNASTTNKQFQSITRHTLRDGGSYIELIFPNWRGNNTNGTEVGSGGVLTLTASVEYPAASGNIVQVLFDGIATATIADGANSVVGRATLDFVAGQDIYVRAFGSNPFGIVYTASGGVIDSGRGERLRVAASALTDHTMVAGSITDNAGGFTYTPIVILGMTTKASVFLAGDSIQNGFGGGFAVDDTSDEGIVARSIGPTLAYGCFAVNGDRVNWAATNYAKRLALAQYFSHMACNYGRNDLASASRTAAQVLADLNAFYGLFPAGMPKFQTTITPTTTGAWTLADGSDQTLHASEAARDTLNASIRAVPVALTGIFDTAPVNEITLDGGKWIAPGRTADGTHPTEAGYIAVKTAGVVNPALFVR